jgi:Zn-dependent oligopeptidase
MLEKFTKKDKRTNLEKEIDSVLVVLTNMKADLEGSNSENLDNQIDSLLNSMSRVDTGSEDYLNMAKALDILYKAKASVSTKLEEYSEMVKNYQVLCERREKVKERNREIKK